jgi:hypothetical protein
VAAGVIAVIVAVRSWVVASGTGDPGKQANHLALAMAGAAVVIASSVVWVAHGRREVASRRRLVIERLEAVVPVNVARTLADEAASEGSATDTGFVVLAGRDRYHRHDCLLVRGKPVILTSPDGLQPCAMCQP